MERNRRWIMWAAGLICGACFACGTGTPSIAEAAPLPCAPGTTNSYTALGSTGCTLGDKLVFGFIVQGDFPIVLDITPDVVSPLNPGLIFTGSPGPITESAGQLQAFKFQYAVQSLSGKLSIKDASATMQASQTGTGQVQILQGVCPGGVGDNCLTAPGNIPLTLIANGGQKITTAEVGFAQTSVVVEGTNLLVAGGSSGTATLSAFAQHFSQVPVQAVPEPGSLALFGSGLLGLAWFRRCCRRGETTDGAPTTKG
jgi:hypothetical protein